MNRAEFRSLIWNKPLILDGATGTWLQEHGLTPGCCPTTWLLENPEPLTELQTSYYANGADIVLAFSFGANRFKLNSQTLATTSVAAVNQQVAAISLAVRDACMASSGRNLYVAGDLAPTGEFLYPAGDLKFEELVNVYGEQVDGLLTAGVDLFIVETMIDLAQTRAAVLAVRDRCDLPVIASLTLGENGRTLSGDLPLAALLSLQAAGADAFGFNCSFGPDKLAEILLPLLAESNLPLLLKPNAGLPALIDGKTVFPLSAQAFAIAMRPAAVAGVRLLGGCCGSSPEHIRHLSEMVCSLSPPAFEPLPPDTRICSSRSVIDLTDLGQLTVLEVRDPTDLVDDLLTVAEDEPEGIWLDFRSLETTDYEQILLAMAELSMSVTQPLAFSGPDDLIQRLLRQYPGRAAIYGQPAPPVLDPLVL